MSEWRLVYHSRPWTVNSERKWNHFRRAEVVRAWREAFYVLAKEAKIPSLRLIEVEATPVLSGRGRPQDVGAAGNAVKAAIDGIVDAGVVPDDSPTYLRKISFCAPEKGPNCLILIVRDLAP
jgi:crossover junction endodeoxyribonuclease RusA